MASAAAELVERRGGAKENAELQSTVRTQSRAAVSQAQSRIREAVIRNRRDKLTALLHHLTVDVLRASFKGQRVERDERRLMAQPRRDSARIQKFEDQAVNADEQQDKGDVRVGDEHQQFGAPACRDRMARIGA